MVKIKTTWVGGPPWEPTKPQKKATPARKNKTGKSGNGGFAALSMEERARISSLGGKAVHKNGNAHTFTSDTAREAGLKSTRNRGRKGHDSR